MNKERSKIETFFFYVSVIFMLIVPATLLAVFPDSNAGWVAALTGGFVTLVIRFNELSELSLGPLKAKMRDTIAKATATIEQLQELAAVISQARPIISWAVCICVTSSLCMTKLSQRYKP